MVERGIPDDPAAGAKRVYAVTDARRLARRAGRELSRSEPLAPGATAFLAGWAAAIPEAEARAAFCAEAMELLWFGSDGPVAEAAFTDVLRRHAGAETPAPAQAEVERSQRRMRRRGLYDTPIAVVHRQWFFAHERLEAIEHRLDELGATA